LENGLREFLKGHPILKGAAIKRKPGFILFDDVYLYFTLSVNRPEGKYKLRLRTSPQSFSQINPEQNQTLVQIVLQYSEVKGDERVLDLYSGVGNFTLPLAIKAKEVIAIEENRSAVEDAQFNTEKNGIKNCTMIQGKAEEILKHWSREKFNLVVLDPPREGCKRAFDQVAGLRPERMIYVSCEPTTLSRDLHFFSENGYQLQKLCLIDMFPQTYHMEVVALLKSLY
jgi:23S rRNA (uracil1939-C5)-methyltransferase